ncbi:MAG: hypothetical protein K8S13_20290 [Desulfobacula sp.]|uniref:hypothetical protein n=1 Tax=Desulfobacula sp. TaxID=2593537 RepID=UPI0025BC8B5C|nr:hypothetical protein [Desulfobacula sp.]MCD4722177.1 hypothetical protein [Desulfobacula sp.]
MKKMFLCIILLSAVFFVFPVAAGMQSSNYAIKNSVMSNGGGNMGFGSVYTGSTLGQPSPIKSMASDHFGVYSGFWYTVMPMGCVWDFEPDGDVDGADLKMFIQGGIGSDLESFAGEFGRADCPD